MDLAGSHGNASRVCFRKSRTLKEKKKLREVVDELVFPNRLMRSISNMLDDRNRKNLYVGEKRPSHILPAGDDNIGAGQ